jgi:NDP-4-keto-2,6-dideoxyhexose 3-C-methyltransferase
MKITERKTCRACQMDLPEENVLSLGSHEVVDFVQLLDEGRGQAPLDLVVCRNSHCNLLQLRHTVDADTLFRKFWYRSGINEQMKVALKDVVDSVQHYVTLQGHDVVGDIGSNDGTTLGFFGKELRRVGFEPATELARESQKPGTKIVNDYFSAFEALKASHGRKYKCLLALAMFYDLDHPEQFLRDVAQVLHPEGVFVVQMNYLGLMLRNLTFDNIGHEHLCYYSLSSLQPLFSRVGLRIVDVEINDVNGGSFRVYAKPGHHPVEPTVATLLAEEAEAVNLDAILRFGKRVEQTIGELRIFIEKLNKQGKKVYAYGASTRGSTLLQAMFPDGKAHDYIAGVAERDERKVGRRTAGTYLPIVSEQAAREDADFFLILVYHFWHSISQRERSWMLTGGRCIIPLPRPKVVALEEVGLGGKFFPVAMDLPQVVA